MYRLFSVALLPLVLAACSATSNPPDVIGAKSPADSSQGIARSKYQTPVTGYTHRTPSDPKSWTCVNETQAACKESGS
jgi:hypothetical protein